MKIKRKTPRTEMEYYSIIAKLSKFYEQWSNEEELHPVYVDQWMAKFASLSVRIEGKLPFEAAHYKDDEETIKKKFVEYTECNELECEAILAQIHKQDAPTIPEFGPDSEEAEEKN